MILDSGHQTIKQLEKRKGGYYYILIDAEVANHFKSKKSTRIICNIDDCVSYRCGLNHLGDGNFFIIIATKHITALDKSLGDTIRYTIVEDPNQLGVDMPEVLTIFLKQEPDKKKLFNILTDGKKRNLIYRIIKTKDIDKQVNLINSFLMEEKRKNSKH